MKINKYCKEKKNAKVQFNFVNSNLIMPEDHRQTYTDNLQSQIVYIAQITNRINQQRLTLSLSSFT